MSNQSVEQLRAMLAEAESGSVTSWTELQRWREEALGLLRSIMPSDHDRVELFARYPTHSSFQRNRGYVPHGTPSEARELASKTETLASVLSGILAELNERQVLAPELDAAALHPWIAGAVAGLWDSGHHRQAVDEATRAIEIRLKAKLGRQELTGVPLVTAAFNPADPRPGEPRLRFNQFERDARGWTNAHQGAMHFAQGCMMRIRNLYEHHDEEPHRQEALECLGALSLLARWIDEADLEEASP